MALAQVATSGAYALSLALIVGVIYLALVRFLLGCADRLRWEMDLFRRDLRMDGKQM